MNDANKLNQGYASQENSSDNFKTPIYYSFAGLPFAAYNRKEDIGTSDAQSALMTVIGGWIDQAGTYSPDTAQTLTITLTLYGRDDQSIYDQLQVWRALRRKKGKLVKRLPDGTMQYIYARLLKITAENSYSRLRRMLEDVVFTFELISAAWYGRVYSNWHYDDGYYYDSGNFYDETHSYELTSAERSIHLIYGGDYPEKDIQIIITATDSAIPAGLIITTANGSAIRINQAISAGKIYKIDAGIQNVQYEGADAYSTFEILDYHTVDGWFIIHPGENSIRFSGTAAMQVKIFYSDRWA